MTSRPATILGACALFALCLTSPACTRGKKGTAGDPAGDSTGKSTPTPGSKDCYKTAGAPACPPDPSDPSGKMLPTPGAVCSLGPCKACGSASVPSFRDSTGVATAGWCICVQRSDDSGISIYSCFSTKDWPQQAP